MEESHLSPSDHDSLADIRARIYKVDDRLKEVELAIARGNKFPAWASGMVIAFILQLGTTIWWASEINIQVKTIPLLTERCNQVALLAEKLNSINEKLDSYNSHLEKRLEFLENRK